VRTMARDAGGGFVLVHVATPPRGVRASRPQGPVRPRPGRGDPRLHRDLVAVRRADRRRCRRRHHRSHRGGLPRRGARRADRAGLAHARLSPCEGAPPVVSAGPGGSPSPS
jgi:hypothetical protein